MNCATHNTVAAVAYCRTCGKPLCAACAHDVRGTKFCEQCLAERIGDALPPPPPPGTVVPGQPRSTERLPSPGLAALLGFIPGVGAMYNGQFMKGFVHVMAFVCMIWLADHFGPIMVPVFFAYFFYLVFDAYKTAHALELGQPVPDPFGFEKMFGPTPRTHVASQVAGPAGTNVPPGTASLVAAEPPCYRNSVPTGAIVLIVLGLIFLLNTVGFLESGIDRFWPLILIGFGGWLFARKWGVLGATEGACPCDRCKMRGIMWPTVMVTLGMLFLIDNLHGPGFERTWPLLLLAIGGVKLLQSNASEAGHIGGPGPGPLPPPTGAIPTQEDQAQQPTQASSEVNHV